MPRNAGAPLSPNEETTLRRVALGTMPTAHHAADDIRRLAAFELVETISGQVKLTAAGRRRVKRLQAMLDMGSHDDAAYGDAGEALSRYVGLSRRQNG